MYEASTLFKKAITQKNRELRIRCTIEGKVYQDSDVQFCSTEESILTGEDFKFGSATTSRAELTLLNMDESLSAKSFEKKEVTVELGIVVDKFARPTQYVPMGTFLIEKGNKEKNLIKLSCVDKMIYFEKPYDSDLTYPATLLQILQEVCSKASVTLDSTTFTNHDYMVSEKPDFTNVSLRVVLEHISELACGFASINRNGHLEIITFTETDISINRDNYYSMNLSEYEYGPINHVVINNDGVIVESGVGTNIIEIKDNLFAMNPSGQLVTDIYNKVKDFTFKPFTCSWQGNVLTAPGDLIEVSYKNGETYKSFIANQKFTYSTGLKCDITTNARTTIQTEYKSRAPISEKIEKTKNELKSKIEQTESKITLEVERIDTSIASLQIEADNISLRVEEVNNSVAAVNLRADNITLSVQSLDGRMGSAESSISIQAGQISTKVEQNGVISAINQSAEVIDINASRINLTGYVTATSLSTPGQTTIDGGNITTGKIRGIDWISIDTVTPFQVYIGSTDFPSMKVYNGSLRLSRTLNGVTTEYCVINDTGVYINGSPVGGGTAKFG